MTCSCHDDSHDSGEQVVNDFFPDEWPEGWNQDRREELINALSVTGAHNLGFARYMAHELDAQGATVADFIQYVRSMKVNAEGMVGHQMSRQRFLGPWNRLMASLSPRKVDPMPISLVKLFLCLAVGPLVFFVTVLPRIYYWWEIRRHLKYHTPWFRQWWANRNPNGD